MLHRKTFLSLATAGALSLATLSFAQPAFAAGGQTGILRGTVVDAAGAPVAGADVTISGPNGRYNPHTDARGKFGMLGVLADNYTLVIRRDGAVKISQPNIGVVGDDTVDLGTIALPAS